MYDWSRQGFLYESTGSLRDPLATVPVLTSVGVVGGQTAPLGDRSRSAAIGLLDLAPLSDAQSSPDP